MNLPTTIWSNVLYLIFTMYGAYVFAMIAVNFYSEDKYSHSRRLASTLFALAAEIVCLTMSWIYSINLIKIIFWR